MLQEMGSQRRRLISVRMFIRQIFVELEVARVHSIERKASREELNRCAE